jgi:hypothetical protein
VTTLCDIMSRRSKYSRVCLLYMHETLVICMYVCMYFHVYSIQHTWYAYMYVLVYVCMYTSMYITYMRLICHEDVVSLHVCVFIHMYK